MYEVSKVRVIGDNSCVRPDENASRVAGGDEQLSVALSTSLEALSSCLSGGIQQPMITPTIEHIQEWALRQLVLSEQALDRTMFAAVLRLARRAEPPVLTSARAAQLSPSERRVIATVLAHPGRTNKALAAALRISEHTLRNHLASIYDKLGIHRRVELALLGFEPECGCGDCARD